jgi:hypothetical protein
LLLLGVAGYNHLMKLQFFDDPLRAPLSKEDVRFNRLGLYMYEDSRRVAVGFDITPFQQRPNIEVSLRSADGKPAASLNVIEALQTNFNLTLHIPEGETNSLYELEAILYYTVPESGDRQVVDRLIKPLNAALSGEQ